MKKIQKKERKRLLKASLRFSFLRVLPMWVAVELCLGLCLLLMQGIALLFQFNLFNETVTTLLIKAHLGITILLIFVGLYAGFGEEKAKILEEKEKLKCLNRRFNAQRRLVIPLKYKEYENFFKSINMSSKKFYAVIEDDKVLIYVSISDNKEYILFDKINQTEFFKYYQL